MSDGDELHVTYNAMQSGWQDHAPRKGDLVRSPTPGWTELRLEYSAFVVLRGRGVRATRQQVSAKAAGRIDRLRAARAHAGQEQSDGVAEGISPRVIR